MNKAEKYLLKEILADWEEMSHYGDRDLHIQDRLLDADLLDVEAYLEPWYFDLLEQDKFTDEEDAIMSDHFFEATLRAYDDLLLSLKDKLEGDD